MRERHAPSAPAGPHATDVLDAQVPGVRRLFERAFTDEEIRVFRDLGQWSEGAGVPAECNDFALALYPKTECGPVRHVVGCKRPDRAPENDQRLTRFQRVVLEWKGPVVRIGLRIEPEQ